MTPLRQEMIKAMELRNLFKHTKRNHLGSVDRLSRYYNKSPDQLTKEQVEDYLLYLKNEKGNTLGTCAVVASGIRFFFKHIVKKDLELDFRVTTKRDKLPTVLTQTPTSVDDGLFGRFAGHGGSKVKTRTYPQ